MNDIPINDSSFLIAGPAGSLECIAAFSGDTEPQSLAVICHPHPQHGGTFQNKVVYGIDKALVKKGALSIRFNFRGVGGSEGEYDHGKGEVDDLLAVITRVRQAYPDLPLWLAGFSFGAYIAYQAHLIINTTQLLLVAPAVNLFDFVSLPAPKCSCLVIQGEEDEVINSQDVFAWAEQHRAILTVPVPATGHFFHKKINMLQEIITNRMTS